MNNEPNKTNGTKPIPMEEIQNDRDSSENEFTHRIRRTGATTPSTIKINANRRKISFADDWEPKIISGSEEPKDVDLFETNESEIGSFNEEGVYKKEGKIESSPFLRRSIRPSLPRLSVTSRMSFSRLASRPSMVSLKSTLSKMNLELYPERGSFVATSLGQSLAEMPQISKNIYIITQILAAISVSMGSMAVGFSAAYTSPAFASMNETNSYFQITDEQKSWVGSLMPLSALVGSLIGGYLVDALGRKMLILLCGPPFIAAYITIGSALSINALYIGRSIAGFCVGLMTLSLPVYLAETIQPEIRGTLGLLPTTIGNSGILLCFLAGSLFNWSTLAYIGAVIPFIFFCMMIFVPETPRWYVSKGQDEHAYRSLQWLRGSDSDVEFELATIQENLDSTMRQSTKLKDIMRKRIMKPLGISIMLMLVQQLSGINAVIFYTVDIFAMSGSSIDSNLSTLIIGIVNLLSTFVATILIDRLGRKILLYISASCMILSLFLLSSFFYVGTRADIISETDLLESFGWIPLASLMVYVTAFSLGWGPIPWLFMGEALPAQIRGPAASVATAINWTCTFVVTKAFPSMIDILGAYGVFFTFGLVMILGLIFSIIFVPETKGKSLEQIEAEISGRPEITRQRRVSEMSGIFIK